MLVWHLLTTYSVCGELLGPFCTLSQGKVQVYVPTTSSTRQVFESVTDEKLENRKEVLLSMLETFCSR